MVIKSDRSVPLSLAYTLGLAFSEIPDKKEAWQDLRKLIREYDVFERHDAILALGLAFQKIPDKGEAWQELHRLALDKENPWRMDVGLVIGFALHDIPDKEQAWQDLRMLMQDEDRDVRGGAADALSSAFAELPNQEQAWDDLLRMAQDKDGKTRIYVYYCIGKTAISRVDEDKDRSTLKKDLEFAMGYFKRAISGGIFNKERMDYPFHKSRISRKEIALEVEKSINDLEDALVRSKDERELLQVVRRLAENLRESQRLM
jgi:tetratricopeptide (TPR) repeat protein